MQNEHPIGPMENIMYIIQTTSKDRMLDTETFYIYRGTRRNNKINDKLTVKPNVIFDLLVQKDPHNTHTTT
jgi:hypothetical protein